MNAATRFAADDHRHFNREGQAFDKGETFAGVPYDVALEAVEDVRALVPQGVSMAQFALRWILMNQGVTTVIPGAKNAEQAKANNAASGVPALTDGTMAALREMYLKKVAPFVHQRW
jgi:aryl-alcohol dehydrogenase-like predicted oxidoreductase